MGEVSLQKSFPYSGRMCPCHFTPFLHRQLKSVHSACLHTKQSGIEKGILARA